MRWGRPAPRRRGRYLGLTAGFAAACVSLAAYAAQTPLRVGDLGGPDAFASAVGGTVLAELDGVPVTASEVFPRLFLSHTNLALGALEQAVRRRLVVADSDRFGVEVDRGVLDRELDRILKSQSDEFKLARGAEFDFGRYIEERYGTTMEVYRRLVRTQVLEELFLARVVRYEAQLRERMLVRLIVVDDVRVAREIVDKLAEGANFAALAKTHSVDRSAASGGRFPPLAVDCPHVLLEGAARLAPGAVSEISVVERGDVRLYRLIKLDQRIAADPRPYREQAAEIERELNDRLLDPFEVIEWERRARERHRIVVRLGGA